MDKAKIQTVARELFRLMLEAELSEAEAVAAIVMGSTMRLAYDSTSLEDLKLKLSKLTPLFERYAELNLEAYAEAIKVKQNETP